MTCSQPDLHSRGTVQLVRTAVGVVCKGRGIALTVQGQYLLSVLLE